MKNIFISSTFRDMQAERDMVQERVLPALRDEARKYGDNVGVIDLRWGVDTSTLETEEGAAKVLKVCLDEIDRSHPYMLIFLGERYGWIPEGRLIEGAVRGREDKYVTKDYAKSVTALEIEYGALSEQYGELKHCVICFREPVADGLDDAEKALYAEQTEVGRRKLEELKERIKRDLGEEDRLITYSGIWDTSARQLVSFTSNGQPLETVLTNCFVEMFRNDWKEYEALSWQDKEQLAFRALMESKLRFFVGREVLLEEYYQSVVSGTCPIILQGEVGSGKTAIMCKLVERLQKEGKNVFAFFAGAGSMSTNAESLVKQMVYYMENLLGVEEHFGEEEKDETDAGTEKLLRAGEKRVQYDDWMERLGELCFRLPEGEKVYFCIDALDQLFPDEHVAKLDFFARGKNVQVIASCTDEFELPMEAMVKREVKQIPALSEEDAKAVAEGILAAYSRNAYAAMEEEILQKKSIGNPLYISLLIQRLNMMDTEELRQAMTEEEIVALGTGIIREMPEDTEEAMVAVIRNGIDKISEAQDVLFETLQYLAVSRNGLRMSDLQGIFAAKERELPVLDFTLLMKYLDSFFYVHEDDRIDFTHKVIRQGLLKGLTDREVKEEAIKEHLKTLDVQDGLCIREGMYFARICKDEEFAKEMIEQACLERKVELVKAIMNEAVKDGGKFYCGLIEKEAQEESMVRWFFLGELAERQRLAKEEMMAKLAMGEALVRCHETIHEKIGDESSLLELSISYSNLGGTFFALGRLGEALSYYEKMLRCMEQLHEMREGGSSLRELAVSYSNMGDALKDLGREQEALSYYEKALKCDEQLHEKSGSEESLRELAISYKNMGGALLKLGREGEALSYYGKSLKCDEQLHEKSGSEGSLRELSISYNNVGRALVALGQAQEALLYYEKSLECAKQLHEKNKSESSFRDLSISYKNIGGAFMALSRARDALSYYEKSLECDEQLHEKNKSESSFRDLSIDYKNIGNALMELDCKQEALLYYEKALKSDEELHEKEESELSLRELSTGYSNMGRVCHHLGRLQEALTYYEKALKGAEVLHEKSGSEARLRDLSINYYNMTGILQELERTQDSLPYYKKMLGCLEQLYEKNGSDADLHELAVGYYNMGNMLYDLKRYEEAIKYLEAAVRYTGEICRKNPSQRAKRELEICQIVLARAIQEANRLTDASEKEKKEGTRDREICIGDISDGAKERNMRSLVLYADVLLADNQAEQSFEKYTKALELCKSLCEKNDTVPNTRFYVRILKGLYLCLHKLGKAAEAEEYLIPAREEAKKLYARSGEEKDKKLLDELFGY